MSAKSDFWTRRKAGVAAEAAEDPAWQDEAAAEERFEGKSDAEILSELDLPDPDSMREGDDFSVFLSKAIPDRLRRRALRKLWTTNPVLANVDMLVDYGEDFTDAATVVENIQTAYQVGKGMLRHVEEMARQAEASLAEDTAAPVDAAQEPVETERVEVTEDTKPEVDVASFAGEDEEETEQAVRPRRMQFSFGDVSS